MRGVPLASFPMLPGASESLGQQRLPQTRSTPHSAAQEGREKLKRSQGGEGSDEEFLAASAFRLSLKATNHSRQSGCRRGAVKSCANFSPQSTSAALSEHPRKRITDAKTHSLHTTSSSPEAALREVFIDLQAAKAERETSLKTTLSAFAEFPSGAADAQRRQSCVSFERPLLRDAPFSNKTTTVTRA